MNVLFYTDYATSPYTGGIGRVTTSLTYYFRSVFEWKVYNIFAFDVPKDCSVCHTDGSLCLRLHDRLGIRPTVWRNYRNASLFIQKNNVDVVIVQTSVDVPAKLKRALDMIGLKNVKVLFCLHYCPGADVHRVSLQKNLKGINGLIKRASSSIYDVLIKKATISHYRKAYDASDKVVLLSKSYIDLYREFANVDESAKFEVIGNPLSFPAEDIAKTEAKNNTVLIVGRLDEAFKHISTAIDIWAEVEQLFPEWNLEIVGDGPSYQQYKNQIESLHLNRCQLLGRQDPEEYYRHSKIFLMTSVSEGFPMTLIEAQQFGCVPVVFDAFPALRDVIDDGRNGLIISNNDRQAYYSELKRLMSDDTIWQRLSSNAAEDCRRFSIESIAAQWKMLLDNDR